MLEDEDDQFFPDDELDDEEEVSQEEPEEELDELSKEFVPSVHMDACCRTPYHNEISRVNFPFGILIAYNLFFIFRKIGTCC